MTDLEQHVFVVDDDQAVRTSLKLLMKSVNLECELFSSADDFLTKYDPDRSGCLVLDVRMAGMSGLDLQKRLAEMHAILPIIFISGHGTIEMAVGTIHAGAVDFIEKPFQDQDLLDRIQEALELDRKNRSDLAHKEEIVSRFEMLTPRERQVMDLVVNGTPNKAVALDLGISERTVEIHRARVMQKTGADSLARLVQMVVKTRQ